MGEPHSPQRRQKISEAMLRVNRRKEVKEVRKKAMRKRAIEQLASLDPESITHKKCSKCEVVKPIDEFSIRRVKLKCGVTAVYPEASCKACKNARNLRNYERRCAEGIQPEIEKRNREKRTAAQKARRKKTRREYETMRRREAGIPARNFKKPRREHGARVPTEPASILLEVLLETYTKREISIISGVDERELLRIETLETPSIHIEHVDKLLTAFERQGELDELYPLAKSPPERLMAYHVLDPKGILKAPTTGLGLPSDR